MKLFAFFTLLTCLLIATLTSAHNTTHNITKISDGVVLSEVSHLNMSTSPASSSLPVSSGASATTHQDKRHESLTTLTIVKPLRPLYTSGLPLEIPSWELDLRKKCIPVANGRPLASTQTPSTLNTTSTSTPTHLDVSMVTPPPSLTNLTKRQQVGPVPIPYIPSDWTTRVECPVIAGSPCQAVSKYLPFLRDDQRIASEAAARASSLANNGAYVPGMQVPAPSEASSAIVVWTIWLLASFLTCLIAFALA